MMRQHMRERGPFQKVANQERHVILPDALIHEPHEVRMLHASQELDFVLEADTDSVIL